MKPRKDRKKELLEVWAGPKGVDRIQEILTEAIFAGGNLAVPPGKSEIETILWLGYDRHEGGGT